MGASCSSGLRVQIPQRLTGNELATHDGYYMQTESTAYGLPVYAWHTAVSNEQASAPAFLYRGSNGAWVLGPNATLDRGKIQSNTFWAACPTDVESWAYFDAHEGASWSCYSTDAQCRNGSGILVEERCATSTCASCSYSFGPPPCVDSASSPSLELVLGLGIGTPAILLIAFVCYRVRRGYCAGSGLGSLPSMIEGRARPAPQPPPPHRPSMVRPPSPSRRPRLPQELSPPRLGGPRPPPGSIQMTRAPGRRDQFV